MDQARNEQEIPDQATFGFRWRSDYDQAQAPAKAYAQGQEVPGVEGDAPQPHDAFRGGRGKLPADQAWAFRTATVGSGGGVPPGARDKIILFNVVVALEWEPDGGYVQDLRDAFTAASELLFDVTDGYMAIEQVVIGGPDLLGVADFAIFASNRFLPRSQVSGLLEANKYLPIRLGRGLWDKKGNTLSNWSAAPGVLVHEWGHYALGLKDQYLELLTTSIGDGRAELVVPAIGLLADSIMAGSQQTELIGAPRKALHLQDPARVKMSEWAQLANRPEYNTHLGIDPKHQPQAEPPPLVPVPVFRHAVAVGGAMPQPSFPKLPRAALLHCWTYLLRESHGVPYLIQQGLLGINTADTGADTRALLGAQPGDQALLLYGDGGRGRVRRGPVAGDPKAWAEVTPPGDWPMVALTYVGPQGGNRGTVPRHREVARLRVETVADYAPGAITVSPLGDGPAVTQQGDGTFPVPTLDGAVLLRWGEGEQATYLAAQFSEGGCAEDSGFPAHPNPIPSGSGEGNAMLFFHDSQIKKPGDQGQAINSQYRILTTTNFHVPAREGRPRSYVFGVTTNRPLRRLERLRPTLILAFDDAQGLDLRLCRYDRDARTWVPLPGSTTFEDRAFVAAPLNDTTAPGLFADAPRPEFFRLLGW